MNRTRFPTGAGLALAGLFALNLAVRSVFVFWLTDYQSYLTSDALGYWSRALEVYQGSPVDESVAWSRWVLPPFPHLFFARVFHALDWLGLSAYRHEAILMLNILMGSVIPVLGYGIARGLGFKALAAAAAAILLSLYYPNIYLNAFVLSEGPAQFFLCLALFLATRPEARWSVLALAGASLILASAAKPFLAPAGLPFVAYLWLSSPAKRRKFLRPAMFASAYMVTFGILVASYNIGSKGEITNLGGAGGVNLMMKQCQLHSLDYSDHKIEYGFIPSSTHDFPQLGGYAGPVPFTHQEYYVRAARACMKTNPHVWIDNLASLRNLMTGTMYPVYFSAAGATTMLPLFKHVLVALFFLSLMQIVTIQRKENATAAVLLQGSWATSFIVLAILNVDHRHIHTLAPLFVLLSVCTITQFPSLDRRRMVFALATGALVLLALLNYPKTPWEREPGWVRDVRLPYDTLSRPVPEGAVWNAPGHVVLFRKRLFVEFDTEHLDNRQMLEITLDHNDRYRLTFVSDSDPVAVLDIGPEIIDGGMKLYRLAIPDEARQKGFDGALIEPVEGDGYYSVGHVRLLTGSQGQTEMDVKP